MPEVTDADREKALLILPLSESKRDRLYISWAQLRETIAHALAEAREEGARKMRARAEIFFAGAVFTHESCPSGGRLALHNQGICGCVAVGDAIRALPLSTPDPSAGEEKP